MQQQRMSGRMREEENRGDADEWWRGGSPLDVSRAAARKEPVVSPLMTDGCGRMRRAREKRRRKEWWRRRKRRKVLWHMACYHGDESRVDPPNINLLRFFLSAI